MRRGMQRLGARRDRVTLLATVAAAGAVTATMVTADALTRDSIPTPSASQRVDVEVRSAALRLAKTPAGVRRQRARFTVGVRVTNVGPRRLTLGAPLLLVGDARVPPDPNANDGARQLLSPVGRGGVAEGKLRFETAGAVTRGLVAGRDIRLRIGGRTVRLTRRGDAAMGTPG